MRTLLISICISLGLAACGTKGPLELPPRSAAKAPAATGEAPPARPDDSKATGGAPR
jgi:predicted small lipoprotein YifL